MRGHRRFVLCLFLVFLATGRGSADDQADDKTSRIETLLRSYHELGQFSGAALVATEEKVLFRGAFGQANMEWSVPNTPETKFRIASISKAFLAILIFQLADEGKGQLDAKISEYLPEYSAKWGERVTIRQLLTHTSGLPDYNNIPELFRAVQSGALSHDEILRRIAQHDLLFEPGSKFSYSSDGYNVLALLVENVGGKPYDEAIKSRILDAAGLKDTGLARREAILPRRASGYRKGLGTLENAPFYHAEAAAGLYSTVDDLFLFARALLSKQLLSGEHRELMWSVSPHGNAYGWLNFQQRFKNPDEELAVAMTEGAVFGFYARLFILPRDGHVIVLLSNIRSPENYHGEIGAGIINILYGRIPAPPRASVAEAMLEIVRTKGAAAGIEEYRRLKATNQDRYRFGEEELNNLGYLLVREKRLSDAIAVFRLNVEVFPDSWNVYDSLGEVYMLAGKKELAISNYDRSLGLNPSNANAKQMLEKLRAN